MTRPPHPAARARRGHLDDAVRAHDRRRSVRAHGVVSSTTGCARTGGGVVTSPSAGPTYRPSAQRRRAALLQAATEIAGESGAGAATHRAVAARAGVPPATTSYFFGSLTELMEEALRTFVALRTHEFTTLLASLPADSTPDEMAAAFASVLLAGDRTSELAQIEAYLHAARGEGLRDAVADAMAAFETAAEEALRAAGALRPAAGARRFMALSDGFVLQHLANPRPDDEAELLEAIRSLFMAELMTDHERDEWAARFRTRTPTDEQED